MRIIKPLLILSIGGLAISVLTGSAIWHILGLAPNLDIDGRAAKVTQSTDATYDAWAVVGGDEKGTRFSNASQITPANIEQLSVAWSYQSQTFKGREHVAEKASFQTTPILFEDRLLFCTQFNEVIALQPDSGREIWKFDPQIDMNRRPANNHKCRGVAVWHDRDSRLPRVCQARVFTGTVDSRIIALDARTGQRCAEFGNDGEVIISPSTALRWPGEAQITSAPVVVGNLVITGGAISDNLRTHAPLGTVHAFDARTGTPVWQFNPIPQDERDPAWATWENNSALNTGHGNVWSTMSADSERGLVFLPTSSASPDYYGGNRIGDNQYTNSVVALDAATGEVRWHFQTVHHDVWDYDVPTQPGLHSVWRDGKRHDVVTIAVKTGLIFVLDRDTGKPFLPIEERPVPQNGVAGEVLSPTQPFPVITPPLVPNTIDLEHAFGITFWDKKVCRDRLAELRAEGLYTPPSLQGTLAYPFTGGGANWGSTAFDPTRNLMVVNMSNVAQFVRLSEKNTRETPQSYGGENTEYEFAPMEGAPYTMERGVIISPLGLPCSPPPWGILAGVDLDSGSIVWRRTLGTTEDIAPAGLALQLGTPNFGGPIITGAGLIFIGATMDDYLRAFDVESGAELWKGRLPAGGQATPMTYLFKGKQYVVIAAGGHSNAGTKKGDYVVAFALSEHTTPQSDK